MRGDVLRIPVDSVTYLVESPKLADGLKVTLTALLEHGNLSRILHSDRINLDRAGARSAFAEKAGTDEADLLKVREAVMTFLAGPAPNVGEEAAPPDPATTAAAHEILRDADILSRAAGELAALGYAGDQWLLKLVFLVMTSRLLNRPINLVVLGPSGAGKTFLVAQVLRLFPSEAVYVLTGMSERVLAYSKADLKHRMLFVAEAAALHRDGVGASLLRGVAWDAKISYETVQKTPNGLEARLIEREGPTGFVTTTTKRLDPELETRVLSVTVPDTPEQTQIILHATAERANGKVPPEPDLTPWHAAQRWLVTEGDRSITVPYAEKLAAKFPTHQVRARRDFSQLLALVQAHAALHQQSRERDEHGRVVADRRDYEAIYELASPVFGAIVADGLTPAVREAVQAVDERSIATGDDPVTVQQVAEHLGLDKSSTWRRIQGAIRGGWVVNDEDRKGRPAKLRLGDPMPKEQPALPDPESVYA